MKIGVIILGALVVIIGTLAVVAPGDFTIEKTVIVNKPRYYIFDRIKFLKGQEVWNPWSKKDPSIKYDWRGVDGTVGFVSHWVGNKAVGEGEQEIKKIVEGERIDYEIRFTEPMKAVHTSYLTTVEAGDDKTKVTWVMKGKLGFPHNVMFMILKMHTKLEYDFEEGLNVLKAILEKDVNTMMN